MGNNEEVKISKPEKSSSPATDQNNVHVYPDWATMQAYYGHRLAVPPYMNSTVASPHAPPPYMWGTAQSMIPPYGAPYAAFYAHPGVYPHPPVTIASTTLSMDKPVKSTANGDEGFVKKLKEFEGLSMSIGNGNGDSDDHGNERKLTDSEETEGSSDGSNGVTPRADQNGKKRSRQSSPDTENVKPEKKSSSSAEMEVDRTSEKKINAKAVKTMDSVNTALDLKEPASVPLQSLPHDIWLQNERELKRERRKQSNRESARRSRLRKQAEAEELAAKVQVLTAENMTLKSEINKLMENSEKLKHENATLVEKLKDTQLGQTEEVNLHKIDDNLVLKPIGTVNLLARVNNNSSDSNEGTEEDDHDDSHLNTSPKAKLHQLLDASPRSDVLATS